MMTIDKKPTGEESFLIKTFIFLPAVLSFDLLLFEYQIASIFM